MLMMGGKIKQYIFTEQSKLRRFVWRKDVCNLFESTLRFYGFLPRLNATVSEVRLHRKNAFFAV
jgi:hypothetical protein